MDVKPWNLTFEEAETNQAKIQIIKALTKALDKKGNSKVYLYEIHKNDKHIAQVLKYAGDQLQIETFGKIKRIYDLMGFHYVEVENCDKETLQKFLSIYEKLEV